MKDATNSSQKQQRAATEAKGNKGNGEDTRSPFLAFLRCGVDRITPHHLTTGNKKKNNNKKNKKNKNNNTYFLCVAGRISFDVPPSCCYQHNNQQWLDSVVSLDSVK